ncbi:acyltransferase family protein [Luteolibacter algae]|uniref:Acyltransferase family protein n=1 Tax=Luteolibacter algae TaxID=454151 RepID=A0ABW5DBC1_9BACT
MPHQVPPAPDEKVRLTSLDALRGFDMFWIIGGSGMMVALIKILGFPENWVEEFAKQMTHGKWDQYHFTDLIFPLFVFMSGVTVPYSILAKKSKGVPSRTLQLQIIRRTAIIVLIGVSFTAFRFRWEEIRFYQVLWIIGMAYGIGASINLHIRSWKYRIGIFFGILVTYHLAMQYIPYPGKGDTMTWGNNLAAWMDRNLIQTKLLGTTSDPEGSIRIFPAGALGLLGGLVGERIKSYQIPRLRCGIELFAAGLFCLLVGWLWSFSFPIIKVLWSPSYIVWSAGWSLLLLGLFYTLIDVWKMKWLGWVFLPIGMNAITIYAAQWYFPFHASRDFFFEGLASHFENPDMRNFILSAGLVIIEWLILYALYRKKIFLRV